MINVSEANVTVNSTMINVSEANITVNYPDSGAVHAIMSEEYFRIVWLHVLLLLVVMVVGVPGNSLVIAVFFKSQKRKRYNSTQLLVLTLAVTDLSVCALLVPFDLFKLAHYYSIQAEAACRVFEYFRHVAMSLSCFLLTSMAVERHRAICSDVTTAPGSDRKQTVLVIVAVVTSAFVLCSPAVYFIGIQDRLVPLKLVNKFSDQVQEAFDHYQGQTLMFSCEYLDQHDHTIGLRLFGLSSLCFFTCLIVTSVVSYGKIYRKIRQNHLSLRMALNKVAPMPVTQTTTLQGRDGELTQRPNATQTAAGIFTIGSEHDAVAELSRNSSKNTQPHRQLRTRFSRQSFSPGKLPKQTENAPVTTEERKGRPFSAEVISHSVFCSDENDIDVTVDKRNDVTSIISNGDLRRKSLAEVLKEAFSAKDELVLNDSGGGFVGQSTYFDARLQPSHTGKRDTRTTGERDTRTPEATSGLQQCIQSHLKVSCAASPSYSMFIVSHGPPHCNASHNNATADTEKTLKQKKKSGKAFKQKRNGKHWQNEFVTNMSSSSLGSSPVISDVLKSDCDVSVSPTWASPKNSTQNTSKARALFQSDTASTTTPASSVHKPDEAENLHGPGPVTSSESASFANTNTKLSSISAGQSNSNSTSCRPIPNFQVKSGGSELSSDDEALAHKRKTTTFTSLKKSTTNTAESHGKPKTTLSSPSSISYSHNRYETERHSFSKQTRTATLTLWPERQSPLLRGVAPLSSEAKKPPSSDGKPLFRGLNPSSKQVTVSPVGPTFTGFHGYSLPEKPSPSADRTQTRNRVNDRPTPTAATGPVMAGPNHSVRQPKHSPGRLSPNKMPACQASDSAQGKHSLDTLPPNEITACQASHSAQGKHSLDTLPPNEITACQASDSAQGKHNLDTLPPNKITACQASDSAQGKHSLDTLPPNKMPACQASDSAQGKHSLDTLPPSEITACQASDSAQGKHSLETLPPNEITAWQASDPAHLVQRSNSISRSNSKKGGTSTTASTSTTTTNAQASHQNAHNVRFSRQIRVAKILLIVTGAFLLCFLPFWVLTLVFMVYPHVDWQLTPDQLMFMSVLYQSYFVNNAVNPIVFALYSPEFRKECGLLLRGLDKRLRERLARLGECYGK